MSTVFSAAFRWVRLAGIFTGLTLAASFASAAEPGFYIGGIYGLTDSGQSTATYGAIADSIYTIDLNFIPTQRQSRIDTEDSAFGFFGGYRLFTNLAFEGGYLDLGETSFSDSASGIIDGAEPSPADFALSLGQSTTGLFVSALGVLPVSYRWELYGRAGILFSTNELSLFLADELGNTGRARATESDQDLLAGVGASFALAEVYEIRAEFQRIFDAGDEEFGEGDMDVLSIAVTVRF